MKEAVNKPNHPVLAGIVILIIAVVYFVLLSRNQFPEPGANLLYPTEEFAKVDEVETRFIEAESIPHSVPKPKALAIGKDGMLYIAGEGAVEALHLDGTQVAQYSVDGLPVCMDVAPDGELVLGVRTLQEHGGYSHHIETIDADGARNQWEPFASTQTYLTSIAVNDANVFIGDAGNRVVLRYSRDGELLGRIGERDESRDVPGILAPSPNLDIAFDDEGTLWVANAGRLGLESYRDNGDIITSWYRDSLKLDGFSGCCNPSQIAFRSDGKLITCEKGFVRIKVFEPTLGEFEELIAGSKMFAKGKAVRDLVVDPNDRILVLDSKENVVRVFQQKEANDEQTHQPT